MIEQYQLKEFTREYSQEYLRKAGVEEIEIREAIKNSSKERKICGDFLEINS